VPTSQLHTHTRCRRYEAALRASNAADFDDLLGLAVALLRGSHELRQRYLRRFRHVLVDEFQDTNTAQYELVKLLTLPRADLLVVGDPDQAIYGWRGADMTNMTHAFAQDFPDAQVLDLRDNYRSCARIVATAQHVIAANDDWQRAALRPLRPPGHPIEVHVLRDSQEEARFVAAEIAGALARREHPPEQVAVLLRTHVQSRLVEQELVGSCRPHLLHPVVAAANPAVAVARLIALIAGAAPSAPVCSRRRQQAAAQGCWQRVAAAALLPPLRCRMPLCPMGPAAPCTRLLGLTPLLIMPQTQVRRGVPYILVGGVPFWRRMEIQVGGFPRQPSPIGGSLPRRQLSCAGSPVPVIARRCGPAR
jgi:hypothetical protein